MTRASWTLAVAATAAFFIAPAQAAPVKAARCWNTPDPPYQPHERWCASADQKTRWVTGRTEVPLWLKLNPLWWFKNDFEPVAPAWYLPNDKLRKVKWYLRNPLQNAGNYVAGTKDLNYTVHFYKGPPVVTNYADLNQTGCIYTVLDNSNGGNLWFPRTYVSCTNKFVTWYTGTQWSGFYGFKLNIQHSKLQVF
jgi:hypothetical protein